MIDQGVVLLSGGLDSTTVAAIARRECRKLYALTIDYNQRHRIELQAAKNIAAIFQVAEHVVFPLDLRTFGGSSLTEDWDVPKNVSLDEIGTEIPNTYVPARNTVFLSLSLAYAESVGTKDIYIGVSSLDYSGYPDCRPEFLAAFETLANLGTKIGVQSTGDHAPQIRIHAPLIHWSKARTIREGMRLGVDYSKTWTCYDPGDSGISCGKCESCTLRLKAFEELGMRDPLQYATDEAGGKR